jgi:sporulation integral membrane protein YtvI
MDNKAIKKIKAITIYTAVYSLIFILFYKILPYILPFILGLIIAFIAQPLIDFLTKNFKIKRGIVGTVVAILIFAAICTIISFAVTGMISELMSFSSMLSEFIAASKNKGYEIIDKALSYYHTIDPSIINTVKSMANELFSGSFALAVKIANWLLDIVKLLPGILMVILFTLLSSIYFAVDLPIIKKKVFSAFTKENSLKIKDIMLQSNKMLNNYFKSYLILISITFVETFIGANILGIKYSLLLAIVTAISDALPILGPGTILIPTGIIYIMLGNLIKGVGLLVIYLIITIVRQLLEPKIVSVNLGIHPLVVIAAIFIGLKAHGLLGMIFTILYVIFYVVLKKVKVL